MLIVQNMAKSKEKLLARELRREGLSVLVIAKNLHVSKSTVSLWTKDISLTIQQLEQLKQRTIRGAEKGRLLGAERQKNDRLKRIVDGNEYGHKRINSLIKNEFFIAGIALYWAEGNKKMKKIEYCNSDPKLVLFLLRWFQEFFDLALNNFKCYVGVNVIHKSRDLIIKKYWSSLTHIPLSQFTKTSFKQSKSKKIYENFNDHFGTLSIKVLKPARILYKIGGLVQALRDVSLPG
jgi:predicted transcriptional regulator